MYMSYCRFDGTLGELRCCLNEVTDHINEEAEDDVSDHEIKCFKSMVYEFVDFLNSAELLDSEGEIDEDVLELVCKKMKEGRQRE